MYQTGVVIIDHRFREIKHIDLSNLTRSEGSCEFAFELISTQIEGNNSRSV